MLIYILHPQIFKYLEWADSSSFYVSLQKTQMNVNHRGGSCFWIYLQ